MTDNISEQGFELVLKWVRNNDFLFCHCFLGKIEFFGADFCDFNWIGDVVVPRRNNILVVMAFLGTMLRLTNCELVFFC